MKNLLSLIISLLCCLMAQAQEPVEYFNAGNPIKYCGTKYYLAWTENPADNYYVQEYLPKGESFESYNQMFTVSVLFCDRLPLESVQAKINELEQRKKTDPVTNYMIAENNGEYILEFIVSDSPEGSFSTVEVDVHYYKQMTINGRKAIVLCFYSGRAYGDDIKPFIMSIPQKRASWYEGMSKLKINPKFPKD
ncbi:MAG: hypothetical protein K2K93_02295 [Muribaculaceae bacterium]|nr:hypothetical protein [Muribaculaceae bacterium]